MPEDLKTTQKQRDDAYENGGFIPGAEAYPPRWEAQAAAFRRDTPCNLNVAYGAHPREAYDVFWPEGEPKGLFVFVHGGYWKARAKEDWSHFVSAAVAQGHAAALIGYPLAPDWRISQITASVAAGLTALSERVAGPIRLAGHSAGGHLVARMAMPGVLGDTVAARLHRVMPISPVSDLRPLLALTMNETLQLDPEEAEAESPALGRPRPDIALTTVVGAQERPVFLDQNRWLAEAWGIDEIILPGRHHFDVIDPLQDPESRMMRWCLG